MGEEEDDPRQNNFTVTGGSLLPFRNEWSPQKGVLVSHEGGNDVCKGCRGVKKFSCNMGLADIPTIIFLADCWWDGR